MITSGKSYMKDPTWNNDMIDEKTGYEDKVLVVTEDVGKSSANIRPDMSRDMWFPTMWYFDKCRLSRAYAASF